MSTHSRNRSFMREAGCRVRERKEKQFLETSRAGLDTQEFSRRGDLCVRRARGGCCPSPWWWHPHTPLKNHFGNSVLWVDKELSP